MICQKLNFIDITFPFNHSFFVYNLGINFPFTSILSSFVAMTVSFVFDRRLFFTCFCRYKNTAQISHVILKHFYPSSTFHICLFGLNLYVEYQVKWNFLLHRISFRDIKIFAFQLQNHMGNQPHIFSTPIRSFTRIKVVVVSCYLI